MIDEIVKKSEEASRVLGDIRRLPHEELVKKNILPLLRRAVNLKLMIQEDEENDLKRLVVISIKRQDLQKNGLSDDAVQKEIRKYDCHQTSLVVQKKVLLSMFIEKSLEICLTDDEAVSIQTLDDLAEAFTRHLRERKK